MILKTITIENLKGLHARASAAFVSCADAFVADITVKKGDMCVSGKSVMGLLMLAAGCGENIVVTADGPDEAQAMQALQELIARKFGEES